MNLLPATLYTTLYSLFHWPYAFIRRLWFVVVFGEFTCYCAYL